MDVTAKLPVAIQLLKCAVFSVLLGPLTAVIAVSVVGAVEGHFAAVAAIVALLALGTASPAC